MDQRSGFVASVTAGKGARVATASLENAPQHPFAIVEAANEFR